jgi:TRAP-type C4-dicarboxylate transport system substrate-binding protein
MNIQIDEQKILKEILETDGSLHRNIREKVEQELVDEIKDNINQNFLRSSWQGQIDEISKSVLDEIEEAQKGMVIKILKEFYDSYRFKKSNLEILKKLKEFIAEEQD